MGMSTSSSMLLQWWDEWQLSILVLGSLGVRCFLVVAAGARKSCSGRVYRFAIWLSYLGGDALAIYALAALLNIQKKVLQQQNNSSSAGESEVEDRVASRALQVLWAPIMLIHLGGLPNISAYNIEDNELWIRHIATSVSQVAVALYVFYKLWPSSADKRLLAAVILLFIPGIMKCFEKPLALKRSSFYSLVSQPTTSSITTDNHNKEEINLEKYIQDAIEEIKKACSSETRNSEVVESPLKNMGQASASESKSGKDPKQAPGYLKRPDKLFVDLASPYSERLEALKFFWALTDVKNAYELIGAGISNTFDLLYTKDFTMESNRDETVFDIALSLCTWLSSLLMLIAAIGLLHSSHKEAYRGSEVTISFVLLYVSWVVELWSVGTLHVKRKLPKWHGMVSQHNLIALVARNKRHARLRSIAGLLRCTDLFEQLFHMEPAAPLYLHGNDTKKKTPASEAITSLVHTHVKKGWEGIEESFRKSNNAETMMSSYWEFGDIRGHGTLRQVLSSWSLDMAFDKAVLIWHLATDICFFMVSKQGSSSARAISNYMMHLLFSNPEMLMPGSRRNLCTVAYQEIVDVVNEWEKQDTNTQDDVEKAAAPSSPGVRKKEEQEEKIARGLLLFSPAMEHVRPKDIFIVSEACKLALELKSLMPHQKMWEVIQGVWVEMLCFSATRCRGYLHAKSLGSGGEYLSFVWLLMAHAGMETFPERQQRVKVFQTKYS